MKALAIRATLLGIAIWLVLAGRQCFGAWQGPIQHEFWQSSAPDCSARTEGSTWHLPSGQVRTCQLHHGKNFASWRWKPPQEKLIERMAAKCKDEPAKDLGLDVTVWVCDDHASVGPVDSGSRIPPKDDPKPTSACKPGYEWKYVPVNVAPILWGWRCRPVETKKKAGNEGSCQKRGGCCLPGMPGCPNA